MGGRFSRNIPSIKQYQVEPPPARQVPFDREKAMRILRDGVSLINSFYPAGAIEWLWDNRLDVMKQLRDDRKEINRAILEEDHVAVVAAVESSIRHHRKAFAIYEARPPVVEVQGDLLAA